MGLSSIFRYVTPSYWKGSKTPVAPREEDKPKINPESIPQKDLKSLVLSQELLLEGLKNEVGARDDQLEACELIYDIFDEHGKSNYINLVTGGILLLLKTSKPSPEHLKGFASLVLATLNTGSELNKTQIYNLAAWYSIKVKQGLQVEEISKAFFKEVCTE